MLASSYEITPSGGTKVIFAAATAFARKIVVFKKPVRLTSGHRGKRASLDEGWLIIDQKWYPT